MISGIGMQVGDRSLLQGKPNPLATSQLEYVRKADGTPMLPAMPDTLFTPHLLQAVKMRFLETVKVQFEQYRVNKENVFNAPLKSDKAPTQDSKNSLYGFFPVEVCQDFVGSNEGLHLLLKKHVETRLVDGKYSVLNMDINPTWRIYKVSIVLAHPIVMTCESERFDA
jgi:hypothetical protein